MTPEQIREIVRMTVDDLTARNLVKTESYQDILKAVSKKLYAFFNNKGDGSNIGYVLRQLSDDIYIDVIFLQYRDKKTLEFIAEGMSKDISTIKRNKKRLIMQIYEMLEELQ